MSVVTIDGPAGAGKSTVSRQLAGRLGWLLLDTGAMYRAVALAAIRSGVDRTSDDALGMLAEGLIVRLAPGRVLLDGEDVTILIRSIEITNATRSVADSPRVRRRLVQLQREFAQDQDVVTEGRDQGTVVFPEALCKFFLTATPEERARRRHAEFVARGEPVTLDSVLSDQCERDAFDASRAIAPMTPASDALLVDTTGLALDDVVSRLEETVRVCLNRDLAPARNSLTTGNLP